jgi:hypothetical protein
MSMYDLCMIVKLTSGDSILCQVLSDTDENILIRDPLQINVITNSTPDGIRASTYYAPWFQGTDSRIHMIRKMHILSAAIPDEATKEEYARIAAERFDKEPEVKKPTSNKKEDSWLDQLNFKFGSEEDRHKN